MSGKSKLTIEQRLLARTTENLENDCWECDYAGSRGYSSIGIGRKKFRSHRIAWLLWRGEIPEVFHVLHSCDNRKCINPSHLWLGNNADNMKDRDNKKRQAKGQISLRGEKHWCAKLTEEQVREIRSYKEQGCRIVDIATFVKMPISAIYHIISRYTWRHVT